MGVPESEQPTLLSTVQRELVSALTKVHGYELRAQRAEELSRRVLFYAQLLCGLAMFSLPEADTPLTIAWFFAAMLLGTTQLVMALKKRE